MPASYSLIQAPGTCFQSSSLEQLKKMAYWLYPYHPYGRAGWSSKLLLWPGYAWLYTHSENKQADESLFLLTLSLSPKSKGCRGWDRGKSMQRYTREPSSTAGTALHHTNNIQRRFVDGALESSIQPPLLIVNLPFWKLLCTSRFAHVSKCLGKINSYKCALK